MDQMYACLAGRGTDKVIWLTSSLLLVGTRFRRADDRRDQPQFHEDHPENPAGEHHFYANQEESNRRLRRARKAIPQKNSLGSNMFFVVQAAWSGSC